MNEAIVLHPAPILSQATTPVTEITPELLALLDKMAAVMVAHDGIGIAAPQVGESLRVAIVDVDEELGLIEMINPTIIERKGQQIDVEGCLSVPDVYGTVERAEEVTVLYVDREGDEYELTATDLFARAIQHEVDHLDGIVFLEKVIDYLTPEELEAYMEAEDDE